MRAVVRSLVAFIAFTGSAPALSAVPVPRIIGNPLGVATSGALFTDAQGYVVLGPSRPDVPTMLDSRTSDGRLRWRAQIPAICDHCSAPGVVQAWPDGTIGPFGEVGRVTVVDRRTGRVRSGCAGAGTAEPATCITVRNTRDPTDPVRGVVATRDGTQVWAFDDPTDAFGLSTDVAMPGPAIAVAGTTVYVTGTKALIALSTTDGRLLWSMPSTRVLAATTADVLVLRDRRSLGLMDPAGEMKWTIAPTAPLRGLQVDWTRRQMYLAVPVDNGWRTSLRAVRLTDGTTRWARRFPETAVPTGVTAAGQVLVRVNRSRPWISYPEQGRGQLHFGASDSVQALTADGRLRWRLLTAESVTDATELADRSVAVVTGRSAETPGIVLRLTPSRRAAMPRRLSLRVTAVGSVLPISAGIPRVRRLVVRVASPRAIPLVEEQVLRTGVVTEQPVLIPAGVSSFSTVVAGTSVRYRAHGARRPLAAFTVNANGNVRRTT